MIVLDEQLLGRDVEKTIASWYQGAVTFITELRPNTIIKDEAIPTLLRQQNQPTFLTINTKDFWQKITASKNFCIVCFALSDAQISNIPPLLRQLLQMPDFFSKEKRMGNVIRISTTNVSYYKQNNQIISVTL